MKAILNLMPHLSGNFSPHRGTLRGLLWRVVCLAQSLMLLSFFLCSAQAQTVGTKYKVWRVGQNILGGEAYAQSQCIMGMSPNGQFTTGMRFGATTRGFVMNGNGVPAMTEIPKILSAHPYAVGADVNDDGDVLGFERWTSGSKINIVAWFYDRSANTTTRLNTPFDASTSLIVTPVAITAGSTHAFGTVDPDGINGATALQGGYWNLSTNVWTAISGVREVLDASADGSVLLVVDASGNGKILKGSIAGGWSTTVASFAVLVGGKVSPDGRYVGTSEKSSGVPTPFVYDTLTSTRSNLPLVSGTDTLGAKIGGISNTGRVLGSVYSSTSAGSHAVMWLNPTTAYQRFADILVSDGHTTALPAYTSWKIYNGGDGISADGLTMGIYGNNPSAMEDSLFIQQQCPAFTVNPATLATPTVGTSYSQTFTASGGAAPHAFTVVSGALPAWASLNSSTGVLSGLPNNTTTATFTVRAMDANGCYATRSYTVSPVCPTISITPVTLPNGLVGAAYSQALTASGGSPAYLWALTTGTLPVGLALNTSTGVISGTPTTANGAGVSLTFRATDAYGCTALMTLSLKICPVITVNPTSLSNGTVGLGYSQTVSATGGATPYVYAVSTGALPTWATLNSSTGVISGTPNSVTPATFTIRATDANGCTGTRSYTVTPVCPTITVTPTALAQGTINTAYSATLTATGGTAPYSSWTIITGTLPTGLTLNASTGVISGTPSVAASPATTITVRVNDSYGCQGSRAITLQICPAISLSPLSLANGIVGTSYSETMTASGGASPYSFSIASGALPTWASLNAGTGVISGTPNSTNVANFTVRATDANGCAATRAYTVAPVCPTISISPASLTQGRVGQAYSATLTASGGTAPYSTWSVTAGTLPTGLTLNASTGVISGTPSVAASPATSVTVRVNDNFGCQGTQVVSLQICPVITLSPVTPAAGTVGTAYSQTITATGGSTPYTYSVQTGLLPPGLTLNSSTGVVSGTPTAEVSNTVTMRATDANGCSGTQSMTFATSCPPITITPASLPVGLVGSAYSQALSASGGTAPYGSWTVSSGTLPAGLTLNSSTGLISGTPSAGNGAGVAITVQVRDSLNCLGQINYTLKICPIITVNPTSLSNGTVGLVYNQTVSATGGATPYVYAVSTGALPTWASLNSSTGAITGTPNSTTSATFTIRSTDANGCTGTRSYTVAPVCPTISITPTALVQGNINNAYSATLTATGGTAPYASWTITTGTLPLGLTLNASTGVISGTPTSAASPATTLTVRVTDTYGCQGTQAVTLQICPAIVLNPTSLASATVGVSYTQTISASGGATPYAYSISSWCPAKLGDAE